jgi:putative ABC transport system substrate-binding protein
VRRREFITLLGGVAVGWLLVPPFAQAQQVGKVYRIGYLSYSTFGANPHLHEAFRQGMRELGWVEGQNIIIDYRFAEGNFSRLSDLAVELVRIDADVIVATGTPAAIAAKNATSTIPIVATNFGDPVGLGLVASLGHPGKNITGFSFSVGMDIYGKQLELLKETVPQIREVAILSNPANPSHALAIRELKVAAQALRVKFQFLEARGLKEFDGALAAMSKEHEGALLVVSDSVFVRQKTQLADLAAKNRLPSIYVIREHVEAGGLMSYGPNLLDLFRRSATYVNKIFKGAKPADLPVQQPTKFELIINLKTAKALDITIPATLLSRADEVIE